MELLPQSKVKEEKKDEREATIFRKLRVAKTKDQHQKELQTLIDNLEPEKQKIRIELTRFRNKAEQRKSDLLGEIQALEVKRDRIMEPFYQIKFEAQEATTAAMGYERIVKARAKEVNEKSDAVDIKEKHINSREEMLIEKESAIATRDIESIQESERINQDRKTLDAERKVFETNSQATKDELAEKDRDLKSREATLDARVAVADKREQDLDDERQHLNSQQETLKAAFTEAKKKGIL